MKRRILLLLITMLLTTGCTCEYNLTINGNSYKEEVILSAETEEELLNFNKEYEITTDKDEYNQILSSDSMDIKIQEETYKYNFSNNRLTFNYNFSQGKYVNSTAVSICYNKLTVTNYNNTIIISTSPKADCFEEYSTLSKIKVNIKIDKEVISHNADDIDRNTYTWYITKENATNKSINLVLNNNTNEEDKNINNDINKNEEEKNKNDYTIYIFFGIIAIIIFLGYKWFMKFKEKNNNID